MKKETEFALLEYMKRGHLSYNDIYVLFDIYTSYEIIKIEDLFRNHNSFVNFIAENMKYFCAESELEEKSIKEKSVFRVNDTFRNFSNKFYNYNITFYEQFAEMIEQVVGRDKDVSICEVGGGSIPYSSILLSDRGYKNLTVIDDYNISPECLSRLNIKSHRQLFNAKTSVRGYDVVVGRRPCSAIPYMVENCTAEEIPYFIRLCGCNAPYKSYEQWKPNLSKLDRNIQYFRSYAYNLENAGFQTPEDMKKIIDIDGDRLPG